MNPDYIVCRNESWLYIYYLNESWLYIYYVNESWLYIYYVNESWLYIYYVNESWLYIYYVNESWLYIYYVNESWLYIYYVNESWLYIYYRNLRVNPICGVLESCCGRSTHLAVYHILELWVIIASNQLYSNTCMYFLNCWYFTWWSTKIIASAVNWNIESGKKSKIYAWMADSRLIRFMCH